MVTTVPNAELLIVARLKDELSGGLRSAQGALTAFNAQTQRTVAGAAAEVQKFVNAPLAQLKAGVGEAFDAEAVSLFGASTAASLGSAGAAAQGYRDSIGAIPAIARRAFDADGVKGYFGAVQSGSQEAEGAVEGFATGASRGATTAGVGFASLAKNIAAVTAALGTLALVERTIRFGVRTSEQLVKLASDAEETRNAFAVVFGDVADEQDRFIQRSAANLGRFSDDLRKANVELFSIIKNSGVAGEQAAAITRILTQTGVDLGSVFNIAETDVFDKIRSGIIGQSEPLQRLGIDLRDVRVQQEAYRLGIAETGSELTEQQKILARTAIIIESTGEKYGDAERTADSFANAQRRISAGIQEASVAIGQSLTAEISRFIESIGGVDTIVAAATTGLRVLAETAKIAIEGLTDVLSFVRSLGVGDVFFQQFDNERFETVKKRIEGLFETPESAKELLRQIEGFRNLGDLEIPVRLLEVDPEQLNIKDRAELIARESAAAIALQVNPALAQAFADAGGASAEDFDKAFSEFIRGQNYTALGQQVIEKIEAGLRAGDPAGVRAILTEQLGLTAETSDRLLEGFDLSKAAQGSLEGVRSQFEAILSAARDGSSGAADALGALDARSKSLREELDELRASVDRALGRPAAAPELIDTAGLQGLQEALQAVQRLDLALDGLSADDLGRLQIPASLRSGLQGAAVDAQALASGLNEESGAAAEAQAALDALASVNLAGLELPSALRSELDGAKAATIALAAELRALVAEGAQDDTGRAQAIQAAVDATERLSAALERREAVQARINELSANLEAPIAAAFGIGQEPDPALVEALEQRRDLAREAEQALKDLAAVNLTGLDVPATLPTGLEAAQAAAAALAKELAALQAQEAEPDQEAQARRRRIADLLARIAGVRSLAGELNKLNVQLTAQAALESAAARARTELDVDFSPFRSFAEGIQDLRGQLEGLSEDQLAALAPEALHARLNEQRAAVEAATRARADLIVENARLVKLSPEEIQALLAVNEQLRQQGQAAIDTTEALAELRRQGIQADIPINAQALSGQFDEELRQLIDRRLELSPPDEREKILAEADALGILTDAVRLAAEARRFLIDLLFESGRISEDERDALLGQSEAIERQARALEKLDEQRKQLVAFQKEYAAAIQVGREGAQAISGALQDIAIAGDSFGDAFENAGRRFAQSIARMISDTLAFQAVASIFQGIFGGNAGANFLAATGAPNFFSIFGSALGNVFSGGQVVPFRSGGAFTNQIATAPTLAPLALFGEAGPEAILPLQRDASGRLGVSSQGTGLVVQVTYAPRIESLEGDRAAAVLIRERETIGQAVATAIQENPSLKALVRGTGV